MDEDSASAVLAELRRAQADIQAWRHKYEGSWVTPAADPLLLRQEIARLRERVRALEAMPEPGATALTHARDEIERLRADAAGDRHVLREEIERLRAELASVLAASGREAERAERLRAALTKIQQWDMLTAPDSWGDLPWLKRLVDDALAGPKPD